VPLCERLLFIQNYDQLSLEVTTNKLNYATREKVKVSLNAKNRADSVARGHFSVSVIDESKVPIDENAESTILTNLLLTSELKGTIEQPNYYFTNITNKKQEELDLVMLTHGYRRFEWELVLNGKYPQPVYKPGKALEISGVAKSLLGKPLAKAKVSLISFRGGPFITSTTDDKGRFNFSNLVFIDSAHFILQAVNAKGKNRTQLTYNEFKPLMIPTVTLQADNLNSIIPAAYLENNEKQQEELNRLGLGKGRTLKEVKINDIKRDDKYETQSLAGAGHADQVMHAKDIGYGAFLASNLDGRLRGITFASSTDARGGIPYLRVGASGPMLVVLDGMRMHSGFGINEINISSVATVEVLRFAGTSIYGMDAGNGVLIITTKRGGEDDGDNSGSIGILPIKVTGYCIAREFYSPKYESTTTNSRPDLRSTIYWNPELATDKDGNASFNYYNADGHGSYRVVIEGIDENGNIGRQVYRYKVD
jgi:hypothetical protein